MVSVGKALWSLLFIFGTVLVVLALGTSILPIKPVAGIDVFFFGIGSLSFFVGLYVWKTDFLNS